MKRLRVLVLMDPALVPPDSTKGYTAQEINEWKTEYDIVSTLRAAGHDVRPLGVQEEIKPIRDEIEGFKARLDERLAPVGRLGEGEEPADWEIGECLAQWWRPNFETFMYPFIPAHVTRPKECKKNYFIQLPKNSTLLAHFPLITS